MAKISTKGFEDVERQFLRQSEIAVKAVPLMLDTGAAVLVEAQKAEVDILVKDAKIRKDISKTRSLGDLKKSIKSAKPKITTSEAYVEVYPHGKDSDGTSNAEKGFTLEYGRSNMPAYPWMTIANEKSEDNAHKKMLDIWEELNNDK